MVSDNVDPPEIWLSKKYFDEYSLQFRTTWTLYLTFYVAFLTLNGAALGLTVQYVTSEYGRMVLCATFIGQNILAAGTAFMIARYSTYVAAQIKEIAKFTLTGSQVSQPLVLPHPLAGSPLPGDLGWAGAMANLAGHVLFIILWGVVAIYDFNKTKPSMYGF